MTLLDASAVLAYLNREPGWQMVEPVLLAEKAAISSVNLAEVIAKLCDLGLDADAAVAAVDALTLNTLAFGENEGVMGGRLRAQTRHIGLSLGDRACLATAALLGHTVLTADRPWLGLAKVIGIDIICIRPDAH